MDPIRLALVGCGGMGTRHLHGLRELSQTPFCKVELAAVCDIRQENAEKAAVEAEGMFGLRPKVFTNLEKMVQNVSCLDAVDVVTDPSGHHEVICKALDLGLHVMVEKPLGITVGACRKMVDSAQLNGKILLVAENYRRDPSARLVRHLLQTGSIGTVYTAIFHSLRSGNGIFITPWRHLKERGGPLLDLGVHFTDLVRYQLGDVESVYADVRLVEKTRKKSETMNSPYKFYRDRHQRMDAVVPATAEDFSSAIFRMEGGITVNWILSMSGHGQHGLQAILGDEGVIEGFGNRGGRIQMNLPGGDCVSQEEILRSVNGFELEPLAAHFFPSCVTVSDNAVDWKLIALEYHELSEAILNGREVEVDGLEGMKDVAAVYALCESARVERSVTMDEIMACKVYDYQAEIDAALGIEL